MVQVISFYPVGLFLGWYLGFKREIGAFLCCFYAVLCCFYAVLYCFVLFLYCFYAVLYCFCTVLVPFLYCFVLFFYCFLGVVGLWIGVDVGYIAMVAMLIVYMSRVDWHEQAAIAVGLHRQSADWFIKNDAFCY